METLNCPVCFYGIEIDPEEEDIVCPECRADLKLVSYSGISSGQDDEDNSTLYYELEIKDIYGEQDAD